MPDSVARAQAFVDGIRAHIVEHSARPVTCKAGCFHCCREPVYADREEAVHIIEGIDDRTELTAAVQKWWDAFFGNGLETISPHEQTDNRGLMRYRAARLWCPLLKEGLCSHYSRRPIACRLHLATGSAIRCADDKLRNTQKFAQLQENVDAMREAMRIECDNAPQALFQYDHLGVWLAHLLLGKTERTAAGRDLLVTQTDP